MKMEINMNLKLKDYKLDINQLIILNLLIKNPLRFFCQNQNFFTYITTFLNIKCLHNNLTYKN